MSRIRFLFALLMAVLAAASLHAGPGLFKKKTDPARVSTLIEALKNDPDEKKRRAAADELGGGDSRKNPEVATVLVTALQKDASASVRAEAALSLGDLGQVIPFAGQALETAAANDTSTLVRLAAKRTLWEYHLNGYRSPKGADGIATQTIEPPIASPAGPRPVVALIPAPPSAVTVFKPTPPLVPSLPSTSESGVSQSQPPLASRLILPLFGPRVSRPSFLVEMFPSSRLINRTPAATTPVIAMPATTFGPPASLNLTEEPPRVKRAAIAIPTSPPFVTSPSSPLELPSLSLAPPPTIAFVPSSLPAPPKPDYVPQLPPFKPVLPSVVLPPDSDLPATAPPAMPKIPATLPPM